MGGFYMSNAPAHIALREIKARMRRVPDLCYGCCLCEKVCPNDATHMEVVEEGDHTRKLPVIDENKCVHCGHCASVCMSGAIEQDGFDDLVDAAVDADTRYLVFYCKSLNQGPIPELASMPVPMNMPLSLTRRRPRFNQVDLPDGVTMVEVRCAGRIGARKVFDLLNRPNMKGVVIFSCPPENCMYTSGSDQVALRMGAMDLILSDFGMRQGSFALHSFQPTTADQVREKIEEFVAGLE